MATIYSAQNGNWSDPSTWQGGVIPTTGDTVYIDHVVTYDLNDTTTLLEYVYIRSNGQLIHASGITTGIYVYRLVIQGGKYEMTPNSIHLINARSNSSSGGYLYMDATTTGKLILKGDPANPETTLTSVASIGDPYVTVANVSGFGEGDHIALYTDNTAWNNMYDEGVTVNYVDTTNNRIYIRRRVGPHEVLAETANTANNYLVVQDARKYRKNMKIIIGGTNYVYTISSIDVATNRLYLTTNVFANHPAGSVVYQTGLERSRAVGDKVYKLCTHLTVQADAGTNTITVSNAGGISVGDILVIEGGNASRSGDQFRSEKVTVASVNGNTITLTSNLVYTHEAGLMVIKVNRNCIVCGDAQWGAMVLVGYTTNNQRQVELRNVWFDQLGNAYTTDWRGVFVRGYFNGTGAYALINGCSATGFAQYDWSGMGLYNAYYGGAPIRNCVSWQTHSGIFNCWSYSCGSTFNNISIDNYYANFRFEGTLDYMQHSYNISSNADQWGMLHSSLYRARPKPNYNDDYRTSFMEYNVFRFNRDPFHVNFSQPYHMGVCRRYSIYNCYYPPYYTEIHDVFLLDSECYNNIIEVADRGSGYNDPHWGVPISPGINFLDLNFIPGVFKRYSWRTVIEKDDTMLVGNKPTIKVSGAYTGYMKGFVTRFWVQGGSSVKISCLIRKNSAYDSSNQPGLRIQGSIYRPVTYVQIPNIVDQWIPLSYEFTADYSEFIYVMFVGWHGAGAFWVANSSIVIDGEYYVMPFVNTFMKVPTANHQMGPAIRLQGVTLK